MTVMQNTAHFEPGSVEPLFFIARLKTTAFFSNLCKNQHYLRFSRKTESREKKILPFFRKKLKKTWLFGTTSSQCHVEIFKVFFSRKTFTLFE